jgi:dienelactone hydrolase
MTLHNFRYELDGTEFLGTMIRPEHTSGARPAVLIAHAWGGQGDFERQRAENLAALGYVGVALDIYGDGRTGADRDENARLMQPFLDDRERLAEHLRAGFDAAAAHPAVDDERIAAIGYCFGGLCVLDMARAGIPAAGVVSFHGLLMPPERPRDVAIRSKVLALHGWDDPMVPPAHVEAFGREMTERGADWQLHAYGGEVHAFTNPAANDPGFGTVYSPRADRRSWQTMRSFLSEVFSDEATES